MDVVTVMFFRKLQVYAVAAMVDVPGCSNHTDPVERTLTEVGNWVARRRLELHLDAAEVARTAKIDPKTLASLEKGERWPRDRSRASIEDALGWATGSLDTIRAGGDPTAIDPKAKSTTSASAEPVGPKRSAAIDYSALVAAIAVDADDIQASASHIDTLISTDVDAEEMESLIYEVETLISDVESLVASIENFVDTVNELAKKMMGSAKLQRLKSETRRFRRQQIGHREGPGLLDYMGIQQDEPPAVPTGVSGQAGEDDEDGVDGQDGLTQSVLDLAARKVNKIDKPR